MLFSFVDTSQNWLFSFDIKSGYHHIDIFPPFPGSRMGLLIFRNLLFCLSTCPYIFIKVMRPLVRYWRLQALRIAVYLDDGLGVCPSFADCFSQFRCVPFFRRLFLPVHNSKIGFVPSWFCGEHPEKHLGSSAVSSWVGLSLGFKGQFADCA